MKPFRIIQEVNFDDETVTLLLDDGQELTHPRNFMTDDMLPGMVVLIKGLDNTEFSRLGIIQLWEKPLQQTPDEAADFFKRLSFEKISEFPSKNEGMVNYVGISPHFDKLSILKDKCVPYYEPVPTSPVDDNGIILVKMKRIS